MAKKPKNTRDAFEPIQSNVEDLHRARMIDEATMRNVDTRCIALPAPLKPQPIEKLRERLRVSRPVFARYLNTSESTVEKWETGAKQPSGMARKLLSVVEMHGPEMLA